MAGYRFDVTRACELVSAARKRFAKRRSSCQRHAENLCLTIRRLAVEQTRLIPAANRRPWESPRLLLTRESREYFGAAHAQFQGGQNRGDCRVVNGGLPRRALTSPCRSPRSAHHMKRPSARSAK